MILSIHIRNFKIFDKFDIHLNPDLNILVGDNEAGKSTILEAVELALTKKIGGRFIDYDLSPHLINKTCAETFLAEINAGKKCAPPEILIEIFLKPTEELAPLRGKNNLFKENAVGVRLEIAFDPDYKVDYARMLEDKAPKRVIPMEYYRVSWLGFSGNAITARSLAVEVFSIDATTVRLQSGTDQYVQSVISSTLDAKEKVALAVAYRKLRETFSQEEAIKAINAKIKTGSLTSKALSIGLDVGQKTQWESNLVPHLDSLPFQLSGKGEQTALKIMLALERKATDSDVVLIEEPENHQSFSAMNQLIANVSAKCKDKQIIITTHSAYVLNKLGIDKVQFLHGNKTTSLAKLPADTQDYFQKLSGYDTLRMILAKRAILVEGPSDELIVQRAFWDKHGALPIEKGVDVINVRGLSFARFLDIAAELKKPADVVTDNDGNYQVNVVDRYGKYVTATTRIHADADNTAITLEPQLVKHAGRAALNQVFGTSYADDLALIAFMTGNKTECALRIFRAKDKIKFPTYIIDAVG
jgi:predicted ATPase